MSTVGGRIHYIDQLRGFTIFLVVMGHVLEHGASHSIIREVIYSFHMPLFMMLSGWVGTMAIKGSILHFTNKKTRTLLLPWFVFGTAYTLFCNNLNLQSIVNQSYRGGVLVLVDTI